jgi:hypothetical protein
MRNIIIILAFFIAPVIGFTQTVIWKTGETPQSLDSTSCIKLQQLAALYEFEGKYRQEYDTLKYAMEQCAGVSKYWENFRWISSSCLVQYDVPLERFDTCREWLKKVLYYNTIDPDYYCANVDAIKGTFWYHSGRGLDLLGNLAIEKYLVESGKCIKWTENDYIQDSISIMKEVIYIWRDSVQDSIKTPFNPIIPTLEELNLGILRGPSSVPPVAHETRLGELIATRNPFTDILELKYRLDKSAMVRVDVYDLLGRAVYSEGQGYKAEGEHVLSLQSKAWASGSYYVRLSSPSGEVKTVKVVKE